MRRKKNEEKREIKPYGFIISFLRSSWSCVSFHTPLSPCSGWPFVSRFLIPAIRKKTSTPLNERFEYVGSNEWKIFPRWKRTKGQDSLFQRNLNASPFLVVQFPWQGIYRNTFPKWSFVWQKFLSIHLRWTNNIRTYRDEKQIVPNMSLPLKIKPTENNHKKKRRTGIDFFRFNGRRYGRTRSSSPFPDPWKMRERHKILIFWDLSKQMSHNNKQQQTKIEFIS